MKITAITPILVKIPYDHGAPKQAYSTGSAWDTQPILFVKVETDEGVTGWGEAFGHSSSPVTLTAVSEIVAKLSVGRDPSDIGKLMGDLTRRTLSMARSGPVQFALSGLDIALWDIAGKVAGEPVWRLLGGTLRKESVPAYASLFRLEKPELVAKVASAAVARGYAQIKLHEHSVASVAAARSAIGGDIGLMVDVNSYWDSEEAIVAICGELEEFDLAWLEEPLYPIDSYDVLARIRRQVNVPFAAGENLGNVNDLRWLVAACAVDIVQPSVAKIGGISAMRCAIAHVAADKTIRCAPHSPFLGPALMAAIHIVASMPGDIACEHRFCDLEASPLGDAVVAKQGRLTVPDRPGLGMDVDETVLERYRVG